VIENPQDKNQSAKTVDRTPDGSLGRFGQPLAGNTPQKRRST